MRGMGTRPSFATGWKRATCPTSWGSPRRWACGPGPPRRRCRPMGGADGRPRAPPTDTAARLGAGRGRRHLEDGSLARGDQGPMTSRFLALECSRLMATRARRRTRPVVAGGMAEDEPATTKYWLANLPEHHPAPSGTPGQVPLGDRAGLPAVEGRARAGSLRRARLARLASPCHAGHAGLCVPDAGNAATKKKLLGVAPPKARRELQYLLGTWTGVCPYCRARRPQLRGLVIT